MCQISFEKPSYYRTAKTSMMADEIFHCGAKLVNVSDLNLVSDNTQCGSLIILLLPRFYVKSILGILELQKLPF